MRPWPYFKVKKVYVIKCRLLYCALSSSAGRPSCVHSLMLLVHYFFGLPLFCPLVKSFAVLSLRVCHVSMCVRTFSIFKLFAENLNDVTMTIVTSSPIRILSNLNTNLPMAYLSDKLNFILIRHKRAQIQSREVDRELWRKNGYYVTVAIFAAPHVWLISGSNLCTLGI